MGPRLLKRVRYLAETYAFKAPFLEIGAAANDHAVLAGEYFRSGERHALARRERPQAESIQFHAAKDIHDLGDTFRAGQFGSVIISSWLEHDHAFWLSMAEVKRILAPRGLVLLCVPAFTLGEQAAPSPGGGSDDEEVAEPEGASAKKHRVPRGNSVAETLAMIGPRDYWRFSAQAVRTALLEGFEVLSLDQFLTPPRLLAIGQKLA